MPVPTQPSLFGLTNSNRDFSDIKSWGKNNFNSSFPAALCCFLESIEEKANYLSMKNNGFIVDKVLVKDAFNISTTDPNIYFAFESAHTPFQQYVIGTLPRTDLVIQNKTNGSCLAGLEVKLTALPDNTTCELASTEYGSEIVVRPDTIVYLACSIAKALGRQLKQKLGTPVQIADWTEQSLVKPQLNCIIKALINISCSLDSNQSPFLLQPIWKTEGKSPVLSDNCLDVFFWSDAGLVWFITQIANPDSSSKDMTRQTRTAVWLYKMLLEISISGKCNPSWIVDNLSYNSKNDKAFASAGNVTNTFMRCDRLTTPKIKKSQIKEIILGNGQTYLSPERRFDAIIFNSPDIFV